MQQKFFVIGGEYADTSFEKIAGGGDPEVYGPYNEPEAKEFWRTITGKTVDNAMVRYFLKPAEYLDREIYWVVGGEYADTSFNTITIGQELEVYGPFRNQEALGFWRAITSKTVDDALVRYDIRENWKGE